MRFPKRTAMILPVIGGLAIGAAFSGSHAAVATATTHVGPLAFTRYALTSNNNPVFESARVRHWQRSWTFSAEEPLQQASIANGAIYVSGDGGNLHSVDNDRIYALDAATGGLLWSHRLNNMSMTTPVVKDGLVFVGSGTQQFQGTNLAQENNLNAKNIIRGTGPSAIYALNAKTGNVVWQYTTPGENMPTFVVSGSTLYTANGNGKVYAFNTRSGSLKWTVPLGSYVSMASPVLGPGGVLYVSGGHPYDLYAINTASHRVIWKHPIPRVFGGSDDSSPAYFAKRIYLEGTEGGWAAPHSELFAFSAQSGRLIWRTSLGKGTLPTDIEVSAPVVTGNTVYVGSPVSDSEYAVNAATGKVQWAFKAEGQVSESAAVTPAALYVGDSAGFLYTLNPHTGAEMGSRYFSGAFAADFPLVVGQTLYQPDENGQLFAMPRASLLMQNQQTVPDMPLPSGALGQNILKGQTIFMGRSLSPRGQSCDVCHLGGGALTSYQNGREIPSLLGIAATYPKVAHGKIQTLEGQINHCIVSMGGEPLRLNDPRLQKLSLYLHWLSSGWAVHLSNSTQSGSETGGGCR